MKKKVHWLSVARLSLVFVCLTRNSLLSALLVAPALEVAATVCLSSLMNDVRSLISIDMSHYRFQYR